MKTLAIFAVFFGIYFLLQLVILPKLGINS